MIDSLFCRKNSLPFLAKFFPDSLLGVSADIVNRGLVDESGTLITQMGTHTRLKMIAVYGTLCTIPLRNSNSSCHIRLMITGFICLVQNKFYIAPLT
jgi:hypothetical protein